MLLTWAMWSAAFAGIGLLVLRVLRGSSAPFTGASLRSAMWVGLFIVLLVVLVLHFFVPLGGAVGLGLVSGIWLVGLAGVVAFAALHSQRWARGRWGRAGGLLAVVLTAMLVLAAFLATGEPTNYDTGLYHLGSIAYSADYPLIPGLANLHDRFGFNSSMWPLAAVLGTGAWSGEGFRLVIGLLLAMALFDLLVRLRAGSRSASTVLLAIGLALTLSAVAQYPGRLVASSAQDAAALVLALVSTAYLLDFVFARSWPVQRMSGAVALLVAVVAGTVRPLGWAFAAGTALVLLVVIVRRRGWGGALHVLWLPAALSVAMLAVMLVRDAVLSGWLLFPLTAFPLPFDWQTVSPLETAQKITAWARTPYEDFTVVLADSSWVGGWLLRLPTDWGALAGIVMVLLTGLLVLTVPSCRATWQRQWWRVLVVLVPTGLALLLWFVNAPDPRFAWGYLLALGLVPLSVLIAAQRWWTRLVAVLVAGMAALLVLAAARGALEISWQLVTPPNPVTRTETLGDGTAVLVPVETDQCWAVFPLCMPQYMDHGIALRGDSIADGFRRIDR